MINEIEQNRMKNYGIKNIKKRLKNYTNEMVIDEYGGVKPADSIQSMQRAN